MNIIFLKGSLKMLIEYCLLQVISSESKYLKQKENHNRWAMTMKLLAFYHK